MQHGKALGLILALAAASALPSLAQARHGEDEAGSRDIGGEASPSRHATKEPQAGGPAAAPRHERRQGRNGGGKDHGAANGAQASGGGARAKRHRQDDPSAGAQANPSMVAGGRVGRAAPRVEAAPGTERGPQGPLAGGSARERLHSLGIEHEPQLIASRKELLVSPRRQSSIPYPKFGPGSQPLHGALLRPYGGQAAVIEQHMALVSAGAWQDRALGFDRDERHAGRYYWHHDSGFDFCHYYDPFGFHWYGWYFGSQFFWTRHFGGRWWWYDSAFDRWTYFNEGYWWWQDPYHRDDLYCYRDGAYQPITVAINQAAPSAAAPAPAEAAPPWKSPDGSCQVKLLSGDAFLYDLGDPPAFEPLFLASGVASVEYSPGANGQPLEILLKLNSGGFKLFDAQGRPYHADEAPGPEGGSAVGQPLH